MAERIQNVQRYVSSNGRNFRSYLEAETAKVLDALHIPYTYEEKKIILQKGFHCSFQKDKVRDLTYTPDFMIGNNILLECKGFETPEWKIKKKLVFKYLMENEPDTVFYQIHDCRKQLLEVLDRNWTSLGFAVQVTPKPVRKRGQVQQDSPTLFPSVSQAMESLSLKGKPIGSILRSLVGTAEYIYGYKWQLVKIPL